MGGERSFTGMECERVMGLMVKLLGLSLIFLGCCLAGTELELRLKRQWQFLSELQEVFTYLEKEMTFHRTPLPEALQHGASGRKDPVKGLLAEAAEAASKRDGRTFEEIWSAALEKQVPPEFLTRENFWVVKEAAQALCAHDVVMQKTLFVRCISRMEEAAGGAFASYQEKGRLYRRLSVTGGAFLVILLC